MRRKYSSQKMITINSNLGAVALRLRTAFVSATEANGFFKDKLIRAVAVSIGGDVKVRIYQDGIKSDGSQIGAYKNSYLKLREKRFNRTADSKIILSLTRQEESDFSLIATDPIKTQTGYGLGFKNNAIYNAKGKKATTKQVARRFDKGGIRTVSNLQKAKWHEDRFGKIFSLTVAEQNKAGILARAYVKQFINDLK